MPVIHGEKTAAQRFPGAANTFCIEAMMQDRKALQAGTSHFLGQNFAKASEIVYQTRDGGREFAWTTSWGVSTRLIGGMIMVHGDDDGMIMPPRLAPSHVAILPIIRDDTDRVKTLQYCEELAAMVRAQTYHGRPVGVVLDTRDMNAGEKGWEWIKKGIPVRAEIGPRDMAQNSVFVGRRDRGPRERFSQTREAFAAELGALLDDVQRSLLERARAYQAEHTRPIGTLDEFRAFFTPANADKPELHGGFALSHWCGDGACEAKVNDELSVTIRCVPLQREGEEPGACVVCGKPSPGRVVFAKAY